MIITMVMITGMIWEVLWWRRYYDDDDDDDDAMIRLMMMMIIIINIVIIIMSTMHVLYRCSTSKRVASLYGR